MSAVSVAGPARSRRARLLGWGAFAVALVVIALVGAQLASGGWSSRASLDPESAGPDGARAVARILAEQGIDVRVVRDRAGALRALAETGGALAMADAPSLSDDAVREVADAARGGVVLLEPRSRTLRLLLADSAPAGDAAAGALAPDCGLDAAVAGATIGDLYTAGDGVTGCYPQGEGYGLLTDGSVSALDARAVIANDALAEGGNAALALRLLGSSPTLVWYLPGLEDSDTAAPTLGQLTPGWVTPSIVLLIVAAIAAAVWRGRRFGPLVTETLPVTVRASETTIGRGRLYARSRDRAHAAAQLRRDARRRLARLAALDARLPAAELADAIAARIGADRARVRAALVDGEPADDRALVELDQELRRLDAAARTALRPPSAPTAGRTP
ncbi:DUF4350 domain-containing protein [Microbacterium sp. NPDC091313]